MPFVRSAAIRQIEYDAGPQQIQIWFVDSGGPYTYYGVPHHVYEEFLNAPSKGEYFNDNIKDVYG